jgi:hypothetical protein
MLVGGEKRHQIWAVHWGQRRASGAGFGHPIEGTRQVPALMPDLPLSVSSNTERSHQTDHQNPVE